MSDSFSIPTSTIRDEIGEVYRDHHRWLRAWLCRQLGCSTRAADFVQDTFVRVLLRADVPRLSLTEPRALLTTIAQGLVIDHWRRSQLEQVYLRELALLPEPYTPTLEEQQLAVELLTQVAKMLEDLKPQVRRAFLLAQLEGMKYVDIAARLGISQRSVERHVATALLHCYQLRYGDEQERTR